MPSKNIFNSDMYATEGIAQFLKKDVRISLDQFKTDTMVVGSSKTKLDPICHKKPKKKKK